MAEVQLISTLRPKPGKENQVEGIDTFEFNLANSF